jgi:hypothetical protein
MDLATLRAAQPDRLQRAAQDWDAACSRLEKLSAEFRTQTGTLFEGSRAGAAADAASTSLSGLSARLTVTTGDMAAMAVLYRDAAMGVSGAQALLRTAEDLAASNGLVIGSGGEVSLAAPLGGGARLAGPEAMITAMPSAGQEVADLVARALALAGEVDNQVSAQLARLPGSAAAVTAAGRLAGQIGREMMPPEGLTPQETRDWWQPLSQQAQDRLIREFPATIGWTNGLPATARNAANRLAMGQEKASLERELAQLEAHPPPATDYLGAKAGYVPNPAFTQWQAQVAGIEHELAGHQRAAAGPGPGRARRPPARVPAGVQHRRDRKGDPGLRQRQGAEAGALAPLLIAHAQEPSASYFGTNPAAPAFGGNDFTANVVPGQPPEFSLPYFMTFKAHSSYWTLNSASLINMGYIVDGQYNLVTLAPGSPAGGGE